jgi:hypothetical protein
MEIFIVEYKAINIILGLKMDRAFIDQVINTVIKEQNAKKDFYYDLDLFLSEEYIDKMKILGYKYRDIRWLPLDIPKIEFDDIEEFKHLWEKESVNIVRVKPDVAEPWSKEDHPFKGESSWNVPSFRGLHLFENKKIAPISGDSFCGKLYEGNNRQLKRILEQVFDYFPIHTMFSVFIWQSTREIKPHRDRGFFWKCPTEFRVMLHDENDQPTLYVADVENKDIHYVDCPEETNSFCWSNGTQIHGSDYYGKKKWILCIAGAQNSVESDKLFRRSIDKYRDKLNYKLDI